MTEIEVKLKVDFSRLYQLRRWFEIFVCSMIGHKEQIVEYEYYTDRVPHTDMIVVMCGACRRQLRWVDATEDGSVVVKNRRMTDYDKLIFIKRNQK